MQENFPAVTPSTEVFLFESHEVRTVMRDGYPWFVANDVATVLGYTDLRRARRHCKRAELFRVADLATPSNEMYIIPEGDVFRLAVKSTLPEAEKFEDWVMDEVLPTLRKHGHYTIAPIQPLPTTRDPFQTLQLHYDVLAKHDSDIKSLTNRADQVEDIALDTAAKVEYIENSRGLEPWQAYAIKQEMGAKVYEMHEKYGINRGMLFSASWGFLKRYFKVPTYSAISSKRFEEALMVVKSLTLEQLPPTIIELARGTKRTAKAEKGGN